MPLRLKVEKFGLVSGAGDWLRIRFDLQHGGVVYVHEGAAPDWAPLWLLTAAGVTEAEAPEKIDATGLVKVQEWLNKTLSNSHGTQRLEFTISHDKSFTMVLSIATKADEPSELVLEPPKRKDGIHG